MEPLAASPTTHRGMRIPRRLPVVGATLLPLLLLFPLLISLGAAAPQSTTLSILASDESGLLLELVSPQYIVREGIAAGAPFVELDVPGLEGQVADVGYPQLPRWSGLIGVPSDCDVRVRVLEVDSEMASLDGDVVPVPGLDPEWGSIERYLPDGDAYHQDSLYPAAQALAEPVGYLRDQRLARLVLYPLRVNPTRNLLEHSTRLLVRVDFVGGQVQLGEERVASSPAAESLLESTLLNYDQAQAWRGLPADFRAPEPDLQVGVPAYKIEVGADGMYRVTYDALLAAGMDLYGTDPAYLALTSQGQPVACEWSGDEDKHFEPGESLLFYGQEFRGTVMEEKYTDVNVYWLRDQSTPGLRMETADGTPHGAPAATSYLATVHLEQDRYWHPLHTVDPDNPSGESWQDTWFWSSADAGDQVTVPVTLTAKAPGEYAATVRLKQFSGCRAFTDGVAHRVQLYFNDLLIDDQTWGDVDTTDCSVHVLSGTISQADALENGQDWLTWSVLSSTLNYHEWLNWAEIDYQRRLAVLDNELSFGGDISGTWSYTLTGFTTDAVAVWDISYPLTPTHILSPAVSGTGLYTLAFEIEHVTGTTFIATAAERVRAPLAVIRYVPPDLDPPGGADWVAITHPQFFTEVQRLADYRTIRGLRALVVDVNDVYNQYSAGIYQPAAIRDYLAHALTWSDRAPRYAVLVGDGNWNFKGVRDCYDYAYTVCYPEPIYLPPYLAIVDPVQGEVPADNQYATLVGDDALPDIALGRLPVRTITETELLVDKIIQHESQLLDPAPWRQNVVFVADEIDADGNNYYDQSDAVAALLPDSTNVITIYYTPDIAPYSTPADTAEAILNAFGDGASLINYRGHGAITVWGKDGILYAVEASEELTNEGRLPAVLTMDCLDTYFAFPAETGVSTSSWQAISEVMLRHAGGGSVGHWGSAGLGIPWQHSILHRGFVNALYYGGQSRFGNAAVAAKLYLASSTWPADYLLHTFTLLGDPALQVLPLDRGLFLPLVLAGG